ncbi:MAG TPA: DUF2442 domain-containing protein [Longimicrobiaceae bacterium]|nr:DUF2442 domain-containing protein [Longimicrobiaceae bacterium]
MARKPLTEAEIIASLPAARERARIANAVEPRAASAHYDEARNRIVVELTNGCIFGFGPEHATGLAGATADQLAAVVVEDGGEALHWEELDADVSFPGLMLRILNVRAWAAKYMGQATSEAKAAAARENGRKGGRPRKVAEPRPGLDETT